MVKITSDRIKYALAGGYGYGNLGDDALMVASVSALSQRIAKDDITVVIPDDATDYDYVYQFLPGCNILKSRCYETIYCENVIYGGGTLFFAFPGIKQSRLQRVSKALTKCATAPGHIARRIFIERLASKSYPQISAMNTFGLNIGIGPFIDGTRNIERARMTLQDCKYLSVRDSYSQSLCHQWDIESVVERADLCFCPKLLASTNNNSKEHNGRLKNIGVIIRDWKHTRQGASYKQPLREVVTLLRKNGYEITYITFQQESGWEAEFSDMNKNVLAYSPYNYSVQEFISVLSQFDMIITARAHGAILSATLGIPSVCIEIEPKLKYICQNLKGGGMLWHMPFDENELMMLIGNISSNFRYYCKTTKSAAKQNRELAELSVSELLNAL